MENYFYGTNIDTHTHTHKLSAAAVLLCAAWLCFGNIAYAQQQFHFGGAVLAFQAMDSYEYSINISLAGFVFNQNLVHDATYQNVQSCVAESSTPTIPGYFVPSVTWGGQGDITCSKGNIGCGKYLVTVTSYVSGMPQLPVAQTSFTIDFTDANWVDQANPAILIYFATGGSTIVGFAEVGEYRNIINLSLATYGYFLPGNLKYWEMVRVISVPPWPSYSRDRDNFELPGGNYPLVSPATLDVNVNVTGNITVPWPRIFRVDTDPDVYNNGWETYLSFQGNYYFRVNGSLMADPQWGITTWKNAAGTYWEGLDLDTYEPVVMKRAEVIGADVGIRMTDCSNSNVNIDMCLVNYSQLSGMTILLSDPVIHWSSIADNPNHGIENYGIGTNTRFISSSASRNGYSGIFADGGSFIYAQNSAFVGNGQHGFHLRGTNAGAKARIHESWIEYNINGSNTGSGIYMEKVKGGWVELRKSRVNNNDIGLNLFGQSLLRGWNKTGLPNEWEEPDSTGENCIYENGINIYGDGKCKYELGKAYYDPSTGEPHYLGRDNDIVQPVSHQVDLSNTAEGNLSLNFWNGDYSFNVNSGAKMFYDPEHGSATGACNQSAPAISNENLPENLARMARELEIEIDMSKPIVTQLRNGFLARNGKTTLGAGKANSTPDGYSLANAYPNPFKSSTTLRFTLPSAETVSLRVYDVLGRVVATLASGLHYSGTHTAVFNAAALPAGVYTVVLHTESRVLSTRILLTK